MEKRGDLLNNVLTTIIAIVGLAIIIYAGVKIYQANVNQESVNAQKTIDVLEAKINNIKDGQIGQVLIQGFNGAENWYLFGFDKRVDRPEKCFFRSCICLCNVGEAIAGFGGDFEGGYYLNSGKLNEEGIKKCQQSGFCRFFEVKGIYAGLWDTSVSSIKLKSGMTQLEVNKTKEMLEITDISKR